MQTRLFFCAVDIQCPVHHNSIDIENIYVRYTEQIANCFLSKVVSRIRQFLPFKRDYLILYGFDIVQDTI